jgi:hypothetical protein
MVLGVIGSNGQKCPIVFVSAGERVNADVYQDLLRKHVVPWIQRTYPDGNYVFQQDSVPAHTARTTQEFLRETMAEFWTPGEGPGYAPHKFGGPTPVHHQGVELDVAGLRPPGPAALSAAAWRLSWRKMAAISNRSVCKRSSHNNQPFSGLPKASIRDEGLFFIKKKPL